MKSPRLLEKYFKGVANHRRIEILIYISCHEGVSLDGISEGIDCNIKTVSEHARKLFATGLINKKYKGSTVMHSLSPYGRLFLEFFKSF